MPAASAVALFFHHFGGKQTLNKGGSVLFDRFLLQSRLAGLERSSQSDLVCQGLAQGPIALTGEAVGFPPANQP